MPWARNGPARPDSSEPVSQAVNTVRERRFWMGQLYAALAGYAGCISTIMAYVAITWSQPNRGWILFCSISALVVAGICYLLRRPIVDSPYRLWLFGGWNFASFVFVTLFALLDGGIASPTTYLLILPMLYLAIAYPLPVTLVCGTAGLGCAAALVGFSPGPVAYPVLILKLMALAIGFMLAIIGATIRDHNERELRQLQQRLENLAAIDDLTGCSNQRAFSQALNNEIARAAREQQSLALLLIDVDHFKTVNDRHGHIIGDEVLRQIGAVLLKAARQTDIAGRPGGDEFALLAPNTDREEADILAHRLQREIGRQPLPVNITLSIGICAMVPDTEQAATIRRRADLALYSAKRQGRDRIAFHDEQDDSAADMASSRVQAS